MPHRFTVGMALATALIALLPGCSKANDPGNPTNTAPTPAQSSGPPPASVLAAAVTKTAGVNLKLVLAGDSADENVTGVYDGKQNIASISTASGADRMTIVVTANDLYLSGLSEFKGKTMHLASTKLTAKSPFAVFADALPAATLLAAATDVEETGPSAFAGKLDLTSARGTTVGAQKFLDFVRSAAAGRTTGIPFTAMVNEQGYLVEVKATLPGIDAGKDSVFDMRLSDFGSAVTVTQPSGSKVVEAPAELYG